MSDGPQGFEKKAGSDLYVPTELARPKSKMSDDDRLRLGRVLEMLKQTYRIEVLAFKCLEVECAKVPIAMQRTEGGVMLRCAHRDLFLPDPPPTRMVVKHKRTSKIALVEKELRRLADQAMAETPQAPLEPDADPAPETTK